MIGTYTFPIISWLSGRALKLADCMKFRPILKIIFKKETIFETNGKIVFSV